jgi:predicted amidohydrolase
MENIRVALWATNIERPIGGISEWSDAVSEMLVRAGREGADLLMMPEYAFTQWLWFKPEGLNGADEVAWLADHVEEALTRLREAVREFRVALLAGTGPFRVTGEAGGFVNRAWFLVPDGLVYTQDKLCLAPVERDQSGWQLVPGGRLKVIRWQGLRVVTVVCLDIRLPALAARLAAVEPDLVLVPCLTHSRAAGDRIAAGCQARASELETPVCLVGGIGVMASASRTSRNLGGGRVFLPFEADLGDTGWWAGLTPRGHTEGLGPLLVVPDVPVEICRRLRAGAADVWPGPWSADHVSIEDPAVSDRSMS